MHPQSVKALGVDRAPRRVTGDLKITFGVYEQIRVG